MRKLMWLGMLLMGFGVLQAEEFDVDSVIHPVVAKLGPPAFIEGFGEGQMAISTKSPEAARHFSQGLTLLNASWAFEAYRHFCEAAKHDPDCLMAYWGIAFTLADGQHEFFSERRKAIERILELLESEDARERWNEMEERFAQAAGYLFTDGVGASGRAFAALAEKYPANLQAKMLALFLQRDGFDSSGKPRVGQRKSMEGLRKLLEEHPENLSVMSMWVNSQTAIPGMAEMLREDVLPVAKALVERYPEYPPFRLMLAHTEARCGFYAEALEAAKAARTLFETYRKEEEVTLYDCEGELQARLYEIYLSHMTGRVEEALEKAAALAAIEVEEERVFSVGAAVLLWEGRTIGARLMMTGKTKDDFMKGQKMLDTLPEESWHKGKSYAISYRNCLGIYLGVRAAIAADDQKAAKSGFEQFLLRVQAFQKGRDLASKTSSYSSWLRAMETLRMMALEARGLIAEMEEGASRLSAGTWYLSASEQQPRPSNLLPPTVTYPIQWRLGNLYLSIDQAERAAEAYQDGLELRPNHLGLMRGLLQAAIKLDQKELVESLQEQIDELSK